ncbi:MAG TPA: hypothetical protein VNW49_04160 [Puia sp.]|jgi:hypothetical protein|nr:hypothetical protein [Puia sp.]
MIRPLQKSSILIKLFAGMLVGIFPIIVLYLHSENFHKSKNAFYRVFPSHVILRTAILEGRSNNDYIIGKSASNIYISNNHNPFELSIVNMNLHDTHSVHFSISDYQNYDPSQIMVSIDSPNFFIVDKIRSIVFQGDINNSGNIKTIDTLKFSSSATSAISAKSIILRTYLDKIQSNILTKVNLSVPTFKNSANVLEKQVDGFFCTDGSMQIDYQSNRLVYMYFYRNQFICLDTNLQVIYRSKTLDTNSQSKIEVRIVHEQNILASPPVLVNKFICLSGKSILICSALCADNEDRKAFKNNSVIDVYDSKDGRYRFSFYLPKIHNNKISSFALQGKQLFTIQGNSLVRYDLDL